MNDKRRGKNSEISHLENGLIDGFTYYAPYVISGGLELAASKCDALHSWRRPRWRWRWWIATGGSILIFCTRPHLSNPASLPQRIEMEKLSWAIINHQHFDLTSRTWTFVHNDKYVKTDLWQQRISSSGCPDEERTFKIKLFSECWNFLVFPPRVRSVRIFCYYHCRCSSSYYNLRGGVPFFWAVPKLQSLPLHAILATFQFWKLPK